MKGNSSCHIPNEKFRNGYSRTFEKPFSVIHTACGGQVGWWHGTLSAMEPLKSYLFERMDGTYPQKRSKLNEICPHCREEITDFREMERVRYFEESK